MPKEKISIPHLVELFKTHGSFAEVRRITGLNSVDQRIKEALPNWQKYQHKKQILWTKEEENFLCQNYPEMSTQEIANKLKRGHLATKGKIYTMGLSGTHQEAGKNTAKRLGKNLWNKEKIIKEIQRLQKEEYIHYSYTLTFYSSLHYASYDYFGSWKKAVEAAGFKYETYGIWKFESLDRQYYDSFWEATIANLLLSLKKDGHIVDYESHVQVCEDRNWTCDFVISFLNKPSLWFEFDGLRKRRFIPYSSGNNEKIQYYNQIKLNYVISDSIKEAFKIVLNECGLSNIEDWINKKEIREIKNIKTDKQKEFILNDLRQAKENLGKFPTVSEYEKVGKFSYSVVLRVFGGFINALREIGYSGNKKHSRIGEDNLSCKITSEKAKQIKIFIHKGISAKRISKIMDVSLQIVYLIKSGKTWRHITI